MILYLYAHGIPDPGSLTPRAADLLVGAADRADARTRAERIIDTANATRAEENKLQQQVDKLNRAAQ